MMQTGNGSLAGNDPLMNKLRKYESILVISGLGVVAFGLWSIIRAAIYYFLNPLDIRDYFSDEDLAEMAADGDANGISFFTDNMDVVMTTFIFAIMVIDLLLRIYIGLSARAYGRGRRRRGFFIVVAWILAILTLTGVAFSIYDFFKPIIDTIQTKDVGALDWSARSGDHAASVSVLVDITSFLVLLELCISSLIVKRTRKKLGIRPGKKWRKRKKEIRDLADDLDQELSRSLESVIGE